MRQLPLELDIRVFRVQRDRDRTRAPCADQAHKKVKAVGRHERHSIAPLHPEALLKDPARPGRLLPQLLVRESASAEVGRRGSRGVPIDRALDQRRKRLRLPAIHA